MTKRKNWKLATSRDAILGGYGNQEEQLTGLSKCTEAFPARYILSMFLFLGCSFVYLLRVNLNLSIVAMVRMDNETLGHSRDPNNTDHCPVTYTDESFSNTSDSDVLTADPNRAHTYSWTQTQQGIILGGFYYGYVSTQLIGARIGEIFGPKIVFVGGVFVSSILTLLTPLAADLHVGALVAIRVLIGAFQGSTLPSVMTFLPHWFPPEQISTQFGIISTGNQFGTIIAMLATGYLCHQTAFAGGWPSVFYVFGIIGLVLSVPLFFFVYNTPNDHPRISKRELKLLNHGTITTNKKSPPIPWFSMLTSMPVWALAITRMAAGYGFQVVLAKIPAYLDGVLGHSMESNGTINSMLSLSKSITGILSGYLSDLLPKKGILTINTTRKGFQFISLIGTGAFLAVIPIVECEGTTVIILLMFTMALSGLTSGGEMPIPATMAPAYSGTVFAFCNMFSSATGFVAPMVVGLFLENDPVSLIEWAYVFYSSAGVCVAGAVFFAVFGSANLEPWADIETEEEKELKRIEKENEKY